MSDRYSSWPRNDSIKSLVDFVWFNGFITKPGGELDSIPPGPERSARYDEAFKALREWEDILVAAPGYREVIAWINIELGLNAYDPIGIEKVRREVARRLSSPFHEIDEITLAGAAAVLNRDRTPAAGSVMTSEKKPKRKRNRGKAAQCRGIYLAYLKRKECPPSPTELAAMAECDPSTASRAIKAIEDDRKALMRESLRDRYSDRA